MSDLQQSEGDEQGEIETDQKTYQETHQSEPQKEEPKVTENPVIQNETSKEKIENSTKNGNTDQQNDENDDKINSSVTSQETNILEGDKIDEIIDDMKEELEETQVKCEDNEIQQSSNLTVAISTDNNDITSTNSIDPNQGSTSDITPVPTSNDTEQQVVVVDNMQEEIESKSQNWLDRILEKSGVIIIACVLIVAFVLVGIAIGTNENYDLSIGNLIGFIIANVVLSIIFTILSIFLCIKTWTQTFGQIIFWVVYLANIINIFAISANVGGLFQILLIIYGIIKIFLIPHARVTAKVDGSKLVPSLIKQHINYKFYKSSKFLFCYILLFIVILIQIILISLASLAIVGDFNLLKFFALICIVSLANIPRHFMVYYMANLLKYSIDDDFKQDPLPNNILKIVFNNCKDKLASIVLLSLFVDTSPIWISVANFMYTLQAISVCMGISGAKIAENEENEDREGGCCWCCGWLCCCLSGIIFGISWVLEKIAKFTLQYTAKILLVGAGFLNTTMIGIQKTTREIIKEHKQVFKAAGGSGSKRMFLDDAMSQHITHLCITLSSIFVWFIIQDGTGTAIIVWIGGYAACRCIMEPNATIITEYLNAWYLKPQIIYDNKTYYEEWEARIKDLQIALGDKQIQANETDVTHTSHGKMSRLTNSTAGDVHTVSHESNTVTNVKITQNPNQSINGVKIVETNANFNKINNIQNGTTTSNVNVVQAGVYVPNNQLSNHQDQPNNQPQQYYGQPQQQDFIQSQPPVNNAPQQPY